ncbi:DUF2867 domain-containing protein [Streptomyces sp. NPDC086554]|uniref:DUF2867 domain-containing protein n=1 Tax=unclassified Streptomyces TaxID=2593676 RepID=UPI0033F1EFF3
MSTPRARRVEVPQSLRSSEIFKDSNYASAFELATPDARSRTPEQWGRTTFEGAPALLQRVLRLGWTLVLGLRMGGRSEPGHVLGWLISDSGSESMTLESHSGLVATYNVVEVTDASVVWATSVRFNRRFSRVIWGMAAPVHHLAVPYLLKRASRSAAR